MGIERIRLKQFVDGPNMTFEDAVIKEKASVYPMATVVDDLEEVRHGVRVSLAGVVFTVPWDGIRFTQGTEDKKKKDKD